jgi:hypothetical protein
VKILCSDKVFFHFFENILNGHQATFVGALSHFLPFYRICQCLPSKKIKKNGINGNRQEAVLGPLFAAISTSNFFVSKISMRPSLELHLVPRPR